MVDPYSRAGEAVALAGASSSKLFWAGLAATGVTCSLGVILFLDAPAGAMGGGNPAAIVLRAEQATGGPISNRGSAEGRAHAASHENQGGLAVCVRLCDGYFFPSNGSSSDDEACVAQCPDAETALYREPAGSDRIEDAVSSTGALYSELPAAGRHRDNMDSGCTCHAHSVNYSAMVLHDPTLRRGDVVMTPQGPVVYEGGQAQTPRREDFVALARDSTLPRETRAELSNMKSAAAATEPDRLGAR